MTDIITAPHSQAVPLSSGRRLGISELGDPHGAPILFFHGYVGSRLQCPPDGMIPGALGVRLISIDRPGIGLSDRQPGRRVVDWAGDIKLLADALGLDRFGILGWSAGGPHALACAALIKERVSVLGLCSPMGRWFLGSGATRNISRESRRVTTVARYAPWMLGVIYGALQRQAKKNPGKLVDQSIAKLPAIDKVTLADPDLRSWLIDTFAEPFRNGTGGVVDDTLAVARLWGFEPEIVGTPVWMWQGDADTTVLPALAEELRRALPQSQMTLLPDEGHFTLFTHWREILETLAKGFKTSG
jgi:pimeloyl-ACP methyl ester carboxylesterase